MPLLALLAILVILAIPAGLIYALVTLVRLRREMEELRQHVAALTQTDPPPDTAPGQTAPAVAEPTVAEPAPVPDPIAETAAPPQPPVWKRTAPELPEPDAEPRGPSLVARLLTWLRDHWFYAVSALSLALAGLFLVQYGIETGLLTPTARVVAAALLGLALIGGGEVIRRRFGDDEDSATAYLPSVLSGAGLVSLFGAVLAARLLYDLAAPGPALLGLFGIALAGLVLGWFHGPLLAAIGLIGGTAAPFLVGGSSDSLEWLLGYFGVLTALGLGIDTLRRWAWISGLSVALGFGAGWLLVAGAGFDESLHAAAMLYAACLALLATLIPARSLTPDHPHPCLSARVLGLAKDARPIFPVYLSALALGPASLALLWLGGGSVPLFWIACAIATGLSLLFIAASRPAPGLQDLAALPAAALLLLIALSDISQPLRDALQTALEVTQTQTESRTPWDLTALLAMAVAIGLLAARRSSRSLSGLVWAAAAVLMAPLAGLALELTWAPASLIGAWPWALHALALAAGMTALAARFARADGADKRRAALATLSALACLAFALTVLLTDAALTLALAATVLAATALDRRFDLPWMSGFTLAGVVALGYRLVLDPGLDRATDAPVLEMLAAYGGTTLAFVLALWMLPERPRTRVFLESAAWSTGGMTLSLLLYHVIEAFTGHPEATAHWVLGLHATIWAGLALAQVERLKAGPPLQLLRMGLAVLFGLSAFVLLALALSFGNPLFTLQDVAGPPVLNTLAAAYLLPALVLALGAWRLDLAPRLLRRGLAAVAVALTAVWVALAIRHFWRGAAAMPLDFGTTDPELYSYTVALLATGAALFYQALARRSDPLRRAGVAVIALTVAKVFLIDISGLQGLARVLSFLLLGLALAGLAWLNRWVQSRAQED